MAPYLGDDLFVTAEDKQDLGKLKSRVTIRDVELLPDVAVSAPAASGPSVPDNFMYDFKYNHPLPTSDALGVTIPLDCNAQKEAQTIVAQLEEVMSKGDARSFAHLFLEYGTLSLMRRSPQACLAD